MQNRLASIKKIAKAQKAKPIDILNKRNDIKLAQVDGQFCNSMFIFVHYVKNGCFSTFSITVFRVLKIHRMQII